jgi:tetratricopeptide (TPR) repeat protein
MPANDGPAGRKGFWLPISALMGRGDRRSAGSSRDLATRYITQMPLALLCLLFCLATGSPAALAGNFSFPVRDLVASPTVLRLLSRARQQAEAGLGEQAAATLERAVALEPRDPWLWHRLAVLRLQLGDFQQAIDLAKKSNALGMRELRLQGGNWELIARALEHLGDRKSARVARQRANRYSKQAEDQKHTS